jgi:integrase
MSSRRGHNEGTIYQRPNGKFQAQISLPDGSRKTFTAATKREVQGLVRQAQLDMTSGRVVISNRQTMREFLDSWLAAVEPSVRYSTFRCYELNADRASRYIGRIRLDALQPVHLQKTYAALSAEGLSPRSVELAHAILRAALRYGIRLGVIRYNPADAVIPPRPVRGEVKTLSAEEAQLLFDKAPNPTLRALFVVLTTTGMRIGEALGLKWSDINFEHGTVSIQRAVQRQRDRGLVYIEPKTALSRRTVQLTSFAQSELRQHRARQALSHLNTDVVFTSETGTLLDPTNVTHRFQQTRERAGLPPLRLHDLRHTAATLMLQEGVHPSVVREMLGHSTVMLTLGTYSHVMPNMQREAATKLDRLFAREDRALE